MNDLVKRLSEKKHSVETIRPKKTAAALKECIDRKYVHVMFKDTGTEIGIRLDDAGCDTTQADFMASKGNVHLEGALTLNYEKVKCVVDIDLSTLDGEGILQSVDEVEYNRVVKKNE